MRRGSRLPPVGIIHEEKSESGNIGRLPDCGSASSRILRERVARPGGAGAARKMWMRLRRRPSRWMMFTASGNSCCTLPRGIEPDCGGWAARSASSRGRRIFRACRADGIGMARGCGGWRSARTTHSSRPSQRCRTNACGIRCRGSGMTSITCCMGLRSMSCIMRGRSRF